MKKIIRIALAVSALASCAVAAPDNSTANLVSSYPPNADVIRIWEGRDIPFRPAEDDKNGGHGFGVMRNGSRANVWPEDARAWLQSTIRLK